LLSKFRNMTRPLPARLHALKLFIVFGVFSCHTSSAQLNQALADSFYNFINANKAKASVYITVNDTTIAHLNENKLMPLASTVKIMVAIEFAQQVAHEMINENSFVHLAELDKYYIPNTDGGAHPAWLEYAKNTNAIQGDSIRLIDVARGMTMYSSNANTEYLMDLLGFDNIKDNITLLKLKQHTAIYPLVGSLFMYQIPKKSNEEKLMKSLSKLSDKQYSMDAYDNHMQLKEDSSFKATFRPEEFTMKLQQLWSSRLPASTTKDYVMVAQALNNRELLDEEAFFTIGEILEFPMESKPFQQVFKHYGVKGGSTGFVLTHVIYLTMKNGTRIEMAIFFNDLTPAEEKKLEGWLDLFEAQVIFDKNYRDKLRF
jgi:D-alanyl-D-alanine carboxypeptidase